MRFEKFLTEGIEDKGIFKAVFMAGHPGSGKTFVMNKLKLGTIEPRWVNTDKLYVEKENIAKLDTESALRKFKENWTEGWPLIRDDVKRISKNNLALYLNSMLPLAIDGTSNNVAMINRRKGLLESFGYDTAMVFVNTSLETAIERALGRERQVPPEFIAQAYKTINKAKSYYKGNFQKFLEVPNDKGELTEKVILKSFKFLLNFYNSPVMNPVGQDYIERMKENGWKYLAPNIRDMSEIKKVVSVWYRK